MIKILHGENIVASRQKLQSLLTEARASGAQVVRLEAKKLDQASLEQALGSESLFAEPKLVIIEELHSLPKSAKKDQLLSFVAAQLSQLPENHDLLLWEKRTLTATMLKKFSAAPAEEFKLSKTLFKWLDALAPASNSTATSPTNTAPSTAHQKTQLTLFHQTLNDDDVELCLVMLIRQLRLLIQAKENTPLAGAPFMIAKLKKQAQVFTLEKLIQLHAQLLIIELKMKTSTTALSLVQELDLFLLDL